MKAIEKWNCPVCGHNAYQKYGGVPVPATQFLGNHVRETTVNMGSHYICKGCSVHFGNPYLFNRNKIDENT